MLQSPRIRLCRLRTQGQGPKLAANLASILKERYTPLTQHRGPCGFCGGSLLDCWRSDVFSRCQRCGFIQRTLRPSQEELDAYYETAWSQPDRFSGGTGNVNAVLAREYSRELLHSLQRPDAQGLRILDFGAGRGALIQALQDAGAEAYAVEPYGIEQLREAGLIAYPTLEDLPDGLVFDGIVTMDVFEHLTRPWEDLQALYQRLAPGGWICISTPNPAGMRARFGGVNWDEARNPGHICFMSCSTLSSMLKSAGFSRVRQLNWHISYRRRRLRRKITQRLLMAVGLQGAARVMAFK